jgi:dolichol-phosphate mannosyltransferase
VTIDGDGQNDPRYVAPLLTLAADPNVGLAAGQRVRHAHSRAKKMGSRFANRLRSSLLKDDTRDSACGLKAFRKQVFLHLPYFDNMHRFLPALVIREGLEVRHLDVTDRDRLHGSSKYGIIDRALAGVLDLFGVWWLIRRRRRIPQPKEISPDSH